MSLVERLAKQDAILFAVFVAFLALIMLSFVWSETRVATECVRSGGTWTDKHECLRTPAPDAGAP